ncbi:uncharacterized protein C8Q71DRAFT_114450 [Rhodofomes roseus]|uniref:F-box domain-containing protein n=1 Tax=Rhodofomes roseus TaxID=34475 RepID=A0A4Y9Z7Q5_9APHY|nr:uncharacterized protein C8Q71DRAFT_114450 [Rhodofomes roseus]KAH9835345.1 hypothetical protein C8Q71DRAFT_114450 [Rhodofomes roseus]TFY69841.1 hypothetical protein EVJ58_g167 [Rhodofomes roseus]
MAHVTDPVDRRPARTSSSHLPPELWDHVIDELSSNCPALRACGLTHRAWVASTRRHLFRAVKLNTIAGCEQFRELVLASSSVGTGIAQYVCDVTLTKVRLRLDRPDDPMVSNVPPLERTLSMLPNVSCLWLDDVDVKWWPELPGTDPLDNGYPDRPLRSLFTLPRLRTLHVLSVVFDSISDIVLLLAAFPQASSFQLRYLLPIHSGPGYWPPQLPENMRTDAQPVICIRDLTVAALTETARLLSALKRPPFECALQKLHWGLMPHIFTRRADEESLFMTIVREASSTLKELEVHCMANSIVFAEMDLSLHSHLRMLRVALLSTTDVESNTFPPTFSTLLSRTPDTLRALHLPIQLSVSSDGIPLWSFMDWPSVDETLALLHKRNPLLVVYLRLFCGLRLNARLPEVVQPLMSRLSTALRAGLRVRVSLGGYTPGPAGESVPDEYYWLA